MKKVIEYILIVIGSFIVAALIWLLLFSFTGCRLIRERKTDSTIKTNDSTNLKKQTESSNKVDTSKSKSETTYLKETYIYPPRDTIINNYYPSSPAVYIRESGAKKEEVNTYNYDQRLKEVTDSMRIASLQEKVKEQTKSDTRVGPSLIEWILIAGLGLLILKNFIPFKITKT